MLQAAKERQVTHPPRHGAELKDVVVQDHLGFPMALGELWRYQPAVLVFLRHYGCVFCRAHAVQYYRARDRFEAAGARVAAIGQGTPRQAVRFMRAKMLTTLPSGSRSSIERLPQGMSVGCMT